MRFTVPVFVVVLLAPISSEAACCADDEIDSVGGCNTRCSGSYNWETMNSVNSCSCDSSSYSCGGSCSGDNGGGGGGGGGGSTRTCPDVELSPAEGYCEQLTAKCGDDFGIFSVDGGGGTYKCADCTNLADVTIAADDSNTDVQAAASADDASVSGPVVFLFIFMALLFRGASVFIHDHFLQFQEERATLDSFQEPKTFFGLKDSKGEWDFFKIKERKEGAIPRCSSEAPSEPFGRRALSRLSARNDYRRLHPLLS